MTDPVKIPKVGQILTIKGRNLSVIQILENDGHTIVITEHMGYAPKPVSDLADIATKAMQPKTGPRST